MFIFFFSCHVDYVETADNFFDFLKSILNLSRNYLKKLTISGRFIKFMSNP